MHPFLKLWLIDPGLATAACNLYDLTTNLMPINVSGNNSCNKVLGWETKNHDNAFLGISNCCLTGGFDCARCRAVTSAVWGKQCLWVIPPCDVQVQRKWELKCFSAVVCFNLHVRVSAQVVIGKVSAASRNTYTAVWTLRQCFIRIR